MCPGNRDTNDCGMQPGNHNYALSYHDSKWVCSRKARCEFE
jgi:hypothetical protein